MKKKNFYLLLFALAAFAMFFQSTSAEASSRSRTQVQINVGSRAPHYQTQVIQRPVMAPPVYVQQPAYYDQYGRYYPPVYIAQPQPAYYVEQVYVTPAPRPFIPLSGLSFSWNFFR